MNISVAEYIEYYHLQPHPEGGYFSETYRSGESISCSALPKRFKGARNFSTVIYFLLERGQFSAFHRIQSDECWHFYSGGTLRIYIILANGKLETVYLGNNIKNNESFQFVVPAACWFAAEPADDGLFSFVGCTVAPGFDFADFELAKAEELTMLYPQHKSLIKRLTR
ncbi:MAG TPA: cupin domain-containing protein [Chitinophagaceae bacterium]